MKKGGVFHLLYPGITKIKHVGDFTNAVFRDHGFDKVQHSQQKTQGG